MNTARPLVVDLLDKAGVDHRILKLASPAFSVEDVVRLTGVKASEVCKTILLVASEADNAVVAVVPGHRRLSLKRASETVGQKLRMAKPHEVARMTGYEVGALPPFGHKRPLRVIIDEELFAQDRINFGTEAHDLGVEIRPENLSKVARFEVARISEHAN